jgi:hypothetical protein
VHDLVGNRPHTVDTPGRAVDSPTPPLPRTPVAVDNTWGRWTTMMGLTSMDGMSSTIHSPYYRHCQNLNSL